VIVDDEEPARSLLREYLTRAGGVEIVGECRNGFEAVKTVNDLAPDLLFLDVQMPKLNGFEVLELLGRDVAVVFVTAFDEHAIKAFDVHAVDYVLKPVSPERVALAVERARELVPDGTGPLVAMAQASVWATKRWRPEGFAAVATRLGAAGARIVLLGAAGDRRLCEEIAAGTGGVATSLAGRTDLATMVAVIDRAAVLVGNDSAPMHVACARGVPVVAVFCATTPALGYGPYGPRARVVEVDLACRPCARHGGRRCPRGTDDCMRLVEADAVIEAVRAVWRTERMT